MPTSKEDFDSLGLSPKEWRALVLGHGVVNPSKLVAARASLARLSRYSAKDAADPKTMDERLRKVAVYYPSFWLADYQCTREDKIQIVCLQRGCTAEEAELYLSRVQEENRWHEELLEKRTPKP